ncbi:outer membrane beta-barrel protein [Flavobacterium dankookense]|uniref:Outer membrane protein with beta-barrel domain n=1 Tax=Flavobacterium dankookense TaxID=706186 RepID=A0A4R6QF48_9FLAO|nr:outer membrane beta-barrel protein [Flavobacterium dankookense]TDP61075.1 outer membrane protein with beta-barrel domain [Flavobacterium dankookense]
MNKLFASLILTVLCCNSSFTQSKHQLGFVFGPNYFSLRGSDFLDETKSNFGISYGVSYEFILNNRLSIVTGLSFEQKQIDYNSKSEYYYVSEVGQILPLEYSFETKNKYQYFTLPLLLKYNFGKKNLFFINGGLFISSSGKYHKSSKITSEILYNYPINVEKNNFPFADDMSGVDYGISLGVGKSFRLNSKTKLSVELRDNFGLVNIIQDFNQSGENNTIKTNTLNLITQLSFDL